MKTNEVHLTFGFADGATELLKIGDVADSVLPDVKTKVKALNASYPPVMKDDLVSAGGASSIGIVAAAIVETTETTIFDERVVPTT